MDAREGLLSRPFSKSGYLVRQFGGRLPVEAVTFSSQAHQLGVGDAVGAPVLSKADRAGATTIAVVATDLALTKAEAHRMAVAAHDGIARAVVPAHTPFDGDLVFSASTGLRTPEGDDLFLLGHAAATCLARAIARGVYHAAAAEGDLVPTWSEKFGI